MAGIFNQGVYHGFEINDNGELIERWGNPPTNLTVPQAKSGAKADGFEPNATPSVFRLLYDPDNGFYPVYVVEGPARGGNDVVLWVWAANEWVGPYGG